MIKDSHIFNLGNYTFSNRPTLFYDKGLYRSSLTEEFKFINASNVESILQQAIWDLNY